MSGSEKKRIHVKGVSSFLWYMENVLLCFSVATEHIDNFVLVEFFHVVASRTKVFARVEFSRFVGENFSYCSSHSQAAV